MVYDRYSLSPRKALICRVAGTAFLLSALAAVLLVVLAGAAAGTTFHCGADGCHWTAQPMLLLDEDDRTSVAASAAARRTFDAYAARPLVRLGLVGVEAIQTGPFALLLLGVGLALRRLGGRKEGQLARALPWLRLAALAAIGWALARPVADSLMAMLLAPGTPGGRRWQLSVDVGDIGIALMLGIAAYAAVWAIESGLQAQRDLDDFV